MSKTSDQARRKAWLQFGYKHLPFTNTTMANAFYVRVLGAVEMSY